ncbi:MAG: HPr(Ser) kinase/phosphatase [Clostridia bacterium]|nr:HPr(Ser) kinase/phosphatase [Clostridia bacterium]
MQKTVCLLVEEVAKSLDLTVLEPGNGRVTFSTGEIGRPGLQFTGFYEHFVPERVQLIGNAEMHYLKMLDYEDVYARMERFMGYRIPCIVCSRSNEPPKALLDCAKKMEVPVFGSDMNTDALGHRIYSYVGRELAPTILVHGVLLDVFGVGVLLRGPSGIGKSETAVEMIKMGHRLVADDVVEISRVAPNRLSGRAPELTRHMVEVRGIGIVDVRYMFGVGAVNVEKSIDLCVDLELWNENTCYDRTGTEMRHERILEVDVPTTRIPVSPGRNLSVVVEIAARSFRLRRIGYNAADEFNRRAAAVLNKQK